MNNTIGFQREQQTNQNEKNKLIDDSTHLAIIGKTGSGKTRRALSLLNRRLSKGNGVLVFDPKNILDRDILSIVKDKENVYKLGVDGGGNHSLKINLFSYITQSEQHIERFARSLLVDESSADHRFWSESSKIILTTALSLYGALSNCLLHTSNIIGKPINFSTTITYGEKKEIDFSISSTPLTFEVFWKKVSDRETFRQLTANINEIVKAYLSEIKKHIDIENLSRENALILDTYIYDINRFSKIFSTYRLVEKEDFSGTSGSYFGMLMGVPKILYMDQTLNSTEDTHDVKQLLEEGMCVVISTNNLQVQAFLFNLYTDHFSARASISYANNITFILDESNSLMKNTGTSIDMEHIVTYARASKLSLVALFQSEGQVYQAFGQHNAKTILENVTICSMVDKGHRNPNQLYYQVDDDQMVIGFDPLFTTDQQKYTALKDYQKSTNDFSTIEKSENEVIIFDHSFYDVTQQVTIIDVNTFQSRNVKYIMNEDQYHGYFMSIWALQKESKNIYSNDELFTEELLEQFGLEIST